MKLKLILLLFVLGSCADVPKKQMKDSNVIHLEIPGESEEESLRKEKKGWRCENFLRVNGNVFQYHQNFKETKLEKEPRDFKVLIELDEIVKVYSNYKYLSFMTKDIGGLDLVLKKNIDEKNDLLFTGTLTNKELEELQKIEISLINADSASGNEEREIVIIRPTLVEVEKLKFGLKCLIEKR